MKKTITLICATVLTLTSQAQVVADFESFTLTPNSFYKDTNSVDPQTSNAIFRYTWDKSFGGFWSEGFAYTNKNDTTNGNFSNLYNCAAFKGYNNSNYYATGQAGGVIVLKAPNNYATGFWITNTTYDAKTLKNGDSFCKKFGGPTGNDPDWFKVTVKGYLSGAAKPDSAVFYLADYRSSNNSLDYIVNTWQWVNCTNLGNVDSLKFFMYSSDAGSFGMNTPAFFSIDNFTTLQSVGINETSSASGLNVFPNPVHDMLYINAAHETELPKTVRIYNSLGSEIENIQLYSLNEKQAKIDLGNFAPGLYFIQLNSDQKKLIKFIKD